MKIVAHRGYSARYPENSARAFEQAIAAGADLIETDVRLTSDGVAVCWHDPDLRRVAGISRAIADTSHAAIAQIELPGGARIHTLAEVLALARGRVPVLLDVKLDDDAVRRAIVAAVDAAGMTGEVIYGVRTAEHECALIECGAGFKRLAMPARPALLAGYPRAHLIGARLWDDQIDVDAVQRIRAAGLEVWITAGDRTRGEAPGHIAAERVRALAAQGHDAVLVNDVALARSALDTPPG